MIVVQMLRDGTVLPACHGMSITAGPIVASIRMRKLFLAFSIRRAGQWLGVLALIVREDADDVTSSVLAISLTFVPRLKLKLLEGSIRS